VIKDRKRLLQHYRHATARRSQLRAQYLIDINTRHRINLGASGKIISAFDIARGRNFMFALRMRRAVVQTLWRVQNLQTAPPTDPYFQLVIACWI
jgi:hypothetical protein